MNRQLRKAEDLVGKTIFSTYVDHYENLIIFFTDNTWTVIDYGLPIEEDYFSDSHASRESGWRRYFAQRINPWTRITKDNLELTNLGKEFVRLGYITEDEIIKDWVLHKKQIMSSRVLVAKVQLDNYLRENPEEEYKKALMDYENLQKDFPEYLDSSDKKDLVFKEIDL